MQKQTCHWSTGSVGWNAKRRASGHVSRVCTRGRWDTLCASSDAPLMQPHSLNLKLQLSNAQRSLIPLPCLWAWTADLLNP
mmetsp:Transcript_79940/g.141158  ORF Transcript_79940/g.141158 Transcript_79940/m.141158 type:complete len:81 (+) Transcript_79940:925-1167(+)